MNLNRTLTGLLATLGVLGAHLAASPAQAGTLATCGGEGEKPCGVFDGPFISNGTGFCDAGLQAVGFRVLPDIPAFRANGWVQSANANLQPLRNIINAGKNLEQAFSSVNTSGWYSIGKIGDKKVCDPTGITDACIKVPIYGPKLASELLSKVGALKNLVTMIKNVPDLTLPVALGQGIKITPNIPIGAPKFDFDPWDYIDGDGVDDYLKGFAKASVAFAQKVVNSVIDTVKDFDDPSGLCVNLRRHDWDAEVHLHSDGSIKSGANDLVRGDGVGDVTEMQQSWTGWALAAQREGLGVDEPYNWLQHFDTHNAYNNSADGYILPNQTYSLSDQLNLGVRSIEIDAHFLDGNLKACHGQDDGLGCSLFDRLFDNAIKEVANWLDAHPNEVIFLRLEEYVDDPEAAQDYLDILHARLGDRVWTSADAPAGNTPGAAWPSLREMRAQNKQVIILSYHAHALDGALWQYPVIEQSGSFFEADNPQNICQGYFDLTADPEGDHAVTLDNDGTKFNWRGGDGKGIGFDDRTFLAFNEIVRLTESRPVLETVLEAPETTLLLDAGRVAQLASCRATIISMDFMNAQGETPTDTCVAADLSLHDCRAPDQRMKAGVWSFAEGDYGQYGDAFALDADTGRWHSTPADAQLRFACARLREGAPSTWEDPGMSEWKLTSATGSFFEGGAACAELGPGWEFSAPRIGWQNARLLEQLGHGAVWLNVTDLDQEGQPILNRAPVAVVDAPAMGFEGQVLTFNAYGSYDRENHGISAHWDFGGASATGLLVQHVFIDNGNFPVTLTLTDELGALSRTTFMVRVKNAAPGPQLASVTDVVGGDVLGGEAPAVAGVALSFDLFIADTGSDTCTVMAYWGDSKAQPFTAWAGQVTMTHTFYAPGSHTVVFVATDEDGGQAQTQVTLNVVTPAQVLKSLAKQVFPLSGDAKASAAIEDAQALLAADDFAATMDALFDVVTQLQAIAVLNPNYDLSVFTDQAAMVARSVAATALQAAGKAVKVDAEAIAVNKAAKRLNKGDKLLAQGLPLEAMALYELVLEMVSF